MNKCNNCDRLEEKYNNLYRRFDRLSDSYRDLEKKYNNTYNELSSAESRIHNELEPRIKQEHESYDSWVTSGGGDECFNNGMNGHCGYGCSIFGDKIECFENATSEETILEIYENYVDTGYILELIRNHNLAEKAKEIDKKSIENRINEFRAKISKAEEELSKLDEKFL